MSADTVRLLVPDLGTPPVFEDDQIDALLLLNDGDAYLAAADALDIMVADMAMNGAAATVRTDDLSVNDKEGVAILALRAVRLREQSSALSGAEFQMVYPYEAFSTDLLSEDATWFWA